jgi:hypothetical protein
MGMPPIVFTSQHVKLFSPIDSAIDKKASGKQYKKYCSCEDLDVRSLKLKKGDKPVEFIVRALSSNENQVVSALVYSDEANEGDGKRQSVLNGIQVMLHSVRFGLVDVKGLDGWEQAKRARENFSNVEGWTEETIEAIDGETRMFLGTAILSLSRLNDEKKNDMVAGTLAEMEQADKNQNGQKGASAV